LRHNRLQIVGKLFDQFYKSHYEPRKVALYRSHRVAALRCLPHLIPLGGAITLLVLRWTHHWVGPGSPDATALQFVAKFHELLMQVSVVEILVFIIRSHAIRGFVPLGALSVTVQATQLSYLWSLDFLSIFTSDTFQGSKWHKIGMVVTIPTLLISTALVGPSSAVLMIPGTGCPKYIQQSSLHTDPIEAVFPTQLGLTNGLNM
jgi:hypothetical protein